MLVHGTGIDHSYWDPIIPGLERLFTVYAVDRRGRGGSGDAPSYAIQREFEDVAVFEAGGTSTEELKVLRSLPNWPARILTVPTLPARCPLRAASRRPDFGSRAL